MLVKIWALLFIVALTIYWFAVRGREINWVGFFKALPGIIADLACQLWIDVIGLFKRRRRTDVVEVEDYETFYHD